MIQNSTYLILWRIFAVAVLCCFFSAPATQAAGKQPLPQSTLTLYAKDPLTWKIRPGGAQGTLTYNEQTGLFNFTARKLKPIFRYVLVRNGGITPTGDLLAQGTTNKAGELRLSGSWHDWTGKIWLVSGNDLTSSGTRVTLIDWRPEQYLFEEKVLGVQCGDC